MPDFSKLTPVFDAVRRATGAMPSVGVKLKDDISSAFKAVKDKNIPQALPPMTGWQSKICDEIGYVPTKAWFFQSSLESGVLTVPNQFYADFIRDNYHQILTRLFGQIEIRLET
jgi:hypothetical protein